MKQPTTIGEGASPLPAQKRLAYVIYDFSIKRGLKDNLIAASAHFDRLPGTTVRVEFPDDRAPGGQGEIWSNIVRPRLHEASQVIAYVDKPNANVGFEIGYALGRGNRDPKVEPAIVALALHATKVPEWLKKPPFGGFNAVQFKDEKALIETIEKRSGFDLREPMEAGTDLLFLCPESGEKYLNSANAVGQWRTLNGSGWALKDLPKQLAGIGGVVWMIPPTVDERDGPENAALSVVAGFAKACDIELRVLLHSEAREVLDIFPEAQPVEDLNAFNKLIGKTHDDLRQHIDEASRSAVLPLHMKTVFISHASQDKPFVYRLAFELLGEGVPVWLDKWELGPGDSLISSLDSGLDGSAGVVVIESSHAAATKWVSYEVERTIKEEERLGRRLLVPVRIDASGGLPQLDDRVHITLTDGPDFMEGVHALIDHLRSMGLSTEPSGRCVLPLVFHRRIELDTFILSRIFMRWIYSGFERAEITVPTMQLVKDENYIQLQRSLRARISNYMSAEGATAEGLSDLRRIDDDVVRKERDLRERSALILREFGYGFGLSNGHLIDVVRWFSRVAMYYITNTLEATRSPHVTSISAFLNALEALPYYSPEPKTAAWWNISDPISLPVHHADSLGRYHTTATVIVPRSSLGVVEDKVEHYPGVPLRGAFEFETLTNIVLPQMVHGCNLAREYGPAAWDEDNFRVWCKSD